MEEIQRLNLKSETLTILDIGTGSGCIALFVAKHLPFARVYGVDVNKDAIILAQENQARHSQKDNLTYFLADILHGELLL